MAESIFNNNWGKVALGSTPKIKDSFRSDVTASNLPGKKKEGNTDQYIHASTIREGKHTWTTIETLLTASSFIRESKDDTYSAVITKFTTKSDTLCYILILNE